MSGSSELYIIYMLMLPGVYLHLGLAADSVKSLHVVARCVGLGRKKQIGV